MDIAKLESALKNADAAGDTQAAKVLANQLKRVISQQAPAEQPQNKGGAELAQGGGNSPQQAGIPKLTEITQQPKESRAEQDFRLPGLRMIDASMAGAAKLIGGGAPDLITGADRKTEQTQSLPEVGDLKVPSAMQALKISAGLLATANESDQIDILRENVPGSKFFKDEKGNVIIKIPFDEEGNPSENGQELVLNKPGFSEQDALNAVANVLFYMPASTIAAMGKNLAAKFGMGALGATATQEALQKGAQSLGAERDLSAGERTAAALLGGFSEVAAPAVQGIRQAKQSAKVALQKSQIAKAKEAAKPASAAVEAVKDATGVEVGLFPAQQTQIPSKLIMQRLLPQLDAGAERAAKALKVQNSEAFEATLKMLDTIAPEGAAATGAGRFRSASQLALKAGNEARTAATKGLYDEAFKVGGDVDLKGVNRLINDFLEDAPKGSESFNELIKIKAMLASSKKPSLRFLQKAKQDIGKKLQNTGQGALAPGTKRELTMVSQELADRMGQASPLYKAADKEFARLSPSVKALEDSILGVSAKTKDVDLQNITKRIFSPSSNATTVRQAKKVIDSADPGAWDDMLRTELQRRIGGMKELVEDLPEELAGNAPGQLRRAIFGNPQQRASLLAGMSKEQRKNFVYLDDVLKRASSGRAAGSPTQPFSEASKKIGGVWGVLRETILNPLKTLQSTGEQGIFDRQVARLSNIMFDPKFQPKLQKLRVLKSDTPAAARAMAQLLNPEQDEK